MTTAQDKNREKNREKRRQRRTAPSDSGVAPRTLTFGGHALEVETSVEAKRCKPWMVTRLAECPSECQDDAKHWAGVCVDLGIEEGHLDAEIVEYVMKGHTEFAIARAKQKHAG